MFSFQFSPSLISCPSDFTDSVVAWTLISNLFTSAGVCFFQALIEFSFFTLCEACIKWVYCERHWELQSTFYEVHHWSGEQLVFISSFSHFHLLLNILVDGCLAKSLYRDIIWSLTFHNLSDPMHCWSFEYISHAVSFVSPTICSSTSFWGAYPSM